MAAARVEHIEVAQDIGLDVCARVIDGVAHAGLRGEVADMGEVALGEEPVDGVGVRDVEPPEAQRGIAAAHAAARGCDAYLAEAGLLERGIVICVEVVYYGDLVAAPGKRCGDRRTYKSGSAGDEYFHCFFWLFLPIIMLREYVMKPTDCPSISTGSKR